MSSYSLVQVLSPYIYYPITPLSIDPFTTIQCPQTRVGQILSPQFVCPLENPVQILWPQLSCVLLLPCPNPFTAIHCPLTPLSKSFHRNSCVLLLPCPNPFTAIHVSSYSPVQILSPQFMCPIILFYTNIFNIILYWIIISYLLTA